MRLKDLDAKILDADRDRGGARHLLEVVLPEAVRRFETLREVRARYLLCSCPSTARRYLLGVPLGVTTCHAGAAWLAGFEDPAEYQPLVET